MRKLIPLSNKKNILSRIFFTKLEILLLNNDFTYSILSYNFDLIIKANSSIFVFFFKVCKKKKSGNNVKSPKENSGPVSSRHGSCKLYRHVKLLPLNSVLKVIDIKETEGIKFYCCDITCPVYVPI